MLFENSQAPATRKLATSLVVNSHRGTNLKPSGTDLQCPGTKRLVIYRGSVMAPRLAARRMAPSPLRMAYTTKEVPNYPLRYNCLYQEFLDLYCGPACIIVLQRI